jgi:hypothetical protein
MFLSKYIEEIFIDYSYLIDIDRSMTKEELSEED